VISITGFFDVASRRHNDVILLPAIRRVSGNDFVFQKDSPLAHPAVHVAAVELLRKETPIFLASKQPRSKACVLRDLSCHAASCLPQTNHSLDELKRWLIDVWCCPEQSIFDEAIDQWR